MCSQWLIASQGAGRLLRCQINWHYSPDCVPIFSSHLTQFWCFSNTVNNKKLHTEAFSNPWFKIRFWDMQMSDFRFVFNPKEGKPNRRLEWCLERRLNSVKSCEREARLKSLQTSRSSGGAKLNVTPFVSNSVDSDNSICSYFCYKECAISHNRYEQTSKRKQLRAGILSWAWKPAHSTPSVKTALIIYHWIKHKIK